MDASFTNPRKRANTAVTATDAATALPRAIEFFSVPCATSFFPSASCPTDTAVAVLLQAELTRFVDEAMRSFLRSNVASLSAVDAPGVSPGFKWYAFVCQQKRFVDDAVSMYMAHAMPSIASNPQLVVLAAKFASKAYEHNLRAVFDLQRMMLETEVGRAPTPTFVAMPTPTAAPTMPATTFHHTVSPRAMATPPSHKACPGKAPRVPGPAPTALFQEEAAYDAVDLEVAMFASAFGKDLGGVGSSGSSGGSGRYSPLTNPSPFSVLAGSVDTSGLASHPAANDLGFIVAA